MACFEYCRSSFIWSKKNTSQPMGKPVDFLDWIEEHIQPNTIHTLVNRSWCKFRRVSLATKERIHANAMYTYRCNF